MSKRSIDVIITARDKASAPMKRIGTATGALRSSFNSLKLAAGGVFGGYFLVRGIMSSVKAASEFETQLAKISTMLTSETMPFMEYYRGELQQLAIQYGQSTQTLSDATYDILSASVPAGDAMDVLSIAARAAIGGMTDTATAADALTSVMNAYAMSTDEASDIADKMFATVKRGKLVFQDLAQDIGNVASTAALAGINLDELFAVYATATRAGIKSEMAVTSLRAIAQDFMKPTPASKRAAKKVGIELSSQAMEEVGLVETLKKLSKETPESIAEIFPNIRAIKGAAAAIKDLSGALYDVKLMKDASGMLKEAFDKMAATPGFKFRQFEQRMVKLQRTIGTTMLPALTAFAENSDQIFLFFNEAVLAAGDSFKTLIGMINEVGFAISHMLGMSDKRWGESMQLWMGLLSHPIKSMQFALNEHIAGMVPPTWKYGMKAAHAIGGLWGGYVGGLGQRGDWDWRTLDATGEPWSKAVGRGLRKAWKAWNDPVPPLNAKGQALLDALEEQRNELAKDIFTNILTGGYKAYKPNIKTSSYPRGPLDQAGLNQTVNPFLGGAIERRTATESRFLSQTYAPSGSEIIFKQQLQIAQEGNKQRAEVLRSMKRQERQLEDIAVAVRSFNMVTGGNLGFE